MPIKEVTISPEDSARILEVAALVMTQESIVTSVSMVETIYKIGYHQGAMDALGEIKIS